MVLFLVAAGLWVVVLLAWQPQYIGETPSATVLAIAFLAHRQRG